MNLRGEWRRSRALLGAALICGASSAGAGVFGDVDPYASHNAFFTEGGTPAVLRLLVGESLELDRSSAPARDSIARLYDGEVGRLADPATFLVFDGPRAVLNFHVAGWRHPRRIAFSAVEDAGAPARAQVQFISNTLAKRLKLDRVVVEQAGSTVRVEYSTAGKLPRSPGTVRLDYTARAPHARLGEFLVDDIGRRRPPVASGFATIEEWMGRYGEAECPDARKRATRARSSTREMLRALMGSVHPSYGTRLVYWKSSRDAKLGTTHALVLKVDDTGEPLVDYVRAWLVVPDARGARVPLVILPQQSTPYQAQEALGEQGEVELAMAADLSRHGIASLAFDAAPIGGLAPGGTFGRLYFPHYPRSGYTIKDVDNLSRLLDTVLARDFQASAAVAFDPARVGMWGFSYGSWITLVTAAIDPRVRVVGFAGFDYRDADIAPGLSSALYIPHLACLADFDPPPLSARRLLGELDRRTLAIVTDAGLLAEFSRGLADPRVVVVASPFGHVVTPQVRASALDFFYHAFSIDAKATPQGPAYELASDPAQLRAFVDRENRWRTELVKALNAR